MQYSDEINSSQSYYDDLVREDPYNATAWCIRGMYYNDANNQYNTALECYGRALELDPEYGMAWYLKGITLQNMEAFNKSKICFETAERYGIS